jgi:hypothetical protein
MWTMGMQRGGGAQRHGVICSSMYCRPWATSNGSDGIEDLLLKCCISWPPAEGGSREAFLQGSKSYIFMFLRCYFGVMKFHCG